MVVVHASAQDGPTRSNLSGKVELCSQDAFVRTLIPESGGCDPCREAICPATHM